MFYFTLAFIFDEDCKNLLLIKKNRPAWQAGKYNGIGGKIEKSETAKAGAAREIEEEAGLTINPDDLTPFGEISGATYRIHLFAVSLPNTTFAKYRTMTDEPIESWKLRDVQSLSIFTPDQFDNDIAYLSAMARLSLQPGQFVKAVIARRSVIQ